MQKTCYIFDFDNVLFDRDRFLNFLPDYYASIVPNKFTPEEFTSQYELFKSTHDNHIDMKKFLESLGEFAHMEPEEREQLLKAVDLVPFRNFLFDQNNTLLEKLGTKDVYIISKEGANVGKNTPDAKPSELTWQQKKIKTCSQLWSENDEGTHIHVVHDKSSCSFAEFIKERTQDGYETFVFVNDSPKELMSSYEGGLQAEVEPSNIFLIHHNYGKIAKDGLEKFQTRTDIQFFSIDTYQELESEVLRIHNFFLSIEGGPKSKEKC